jgi:hypothetical protein
LGIWLACSSRAAIRNGKLRDTHWFRLDNARTRDRLYTPIRFDETTFLRELRWWLALVAGWLCLLLVDAGCNSEQHVATTSHQHDHPATSASYQLLLLLLLLLLLRPTTT